MKIIVGQQEIEVAVREYLEKRNRMTTADIAKFMTMDVGGLFNSHIDRLQISVFIAQNEERK